MNISTNSRIAKQTGRQTGKKAEEKREKFVGAQYSEFTCAVIIFQIKILLHLEIYTSVHCICVRPIFNLSQHFAQKENIFANMNLKQLN